MINNDDLLKVVLADTAKKVLESLDSETKTEVIARAIQLELLTGNLRWKLSEIITDEAREIALDYVKQPDVQKQIREKVITAVNEVMEGLSKSVAKSVQNTLKNRYNNWLDDKE
jgi:hypothetical protein